MNGNATIRVAVFGTGDALFGREGVGRRGELDVSHIAGDGDLRGLFDFWPIDGGLDDGRPIELFVPMRSRHDDVAVDWLGHVTEGDTRGSRWRMMRHFLMDHSSIDVGLVGRLGVGDISGEATILVVIPNPFDIAVVIVEGKHLLLLVKTGLC